MGTVNLSKSKVSLEKVLVDLSKSNKVDLSKHMAKVAFATDYSGSMSTLFRNGFVQDIVTRLLPLALKFDDDGELESWLFSNSFERLEAVNMRNYEDYVKNVMLKAKMRMGGTAYAPILEDILNMYKVGGNVPAFIIFITDGENGDKEQTDKIVRELSKYNIFVQFVGIGNSTFKYLEKLDDLDGRVCDNTGFIKVADMSKLTDEELYTELLRQYIDWLSCK